MTCADFFLSYVQGCAIINNKCMAQAQASNPSLVFGDQPMFTNVDDIKKFCIIAAAHISQLATWRFNQQRVGDGSNSEHEIWRLECLTRLHIGNLIYTVSAYATGGATSFEAWYMCIFHPVLEYEAWVTKGDAFSSADFTKDAQNVLGNNNYVHREGNLSTALSTKAVLEVLNRVIRLCKEHPYAWDHHAYVNLTGIGNANIATTYGEYYRVSETPRLIGMATNSSVWAPISVIYGLPGDVMLRRLRRGIKVNSFVFLMFC